ncbi:hypothetical protein [Clostridium sp. YIM B02555]|uniref:hypothetical protein n=1 Tax=Clostridium sp. YIM B02555 TaxID=2911968 RepID=UPI001EEDD988|nr:hypothetical protein [Clostridium sp. YIM B02555]
MPLQFIQKADIVDKKLDESIMELIGDGKKNVFIDERYFKGLTSHNIFNVADELGECEIDGIKAIRKLGAVYLSDPNLNFIDKNNAVFSIAPSLKYSKNGDKITTIEHIIVYSQYDLIVNIDNVNKYNLIVVSYVEAL